MNKSKSPSAASKRISSKRSAVLGGGPAARKNSTRGLVSGKNGHRGLRAKGRSAAPSAKPLRTSAASGNGVGGVRSFKTAVDFLLSQVNYERFPSLMKARDTRNLERARALLKDLGEPQASFKSVHVAGTKGKGSTVMMLAAMLRNNGLKVGAYTSPHVMNIRERIMVNDKMIPEAAFTRLVGRVAKVIERKHKADKPTFFEILTAVAFLYFAEQGVEIAVIETGLGGRLDATNVVRPEACAITSISLDHVQQLGSTLEQIAEEKAGIIKRGIPVVCAPQPKSIKKILRKTAETLKAPVVFAGEDFTFTYRFESSRSFGPQSRICVATARNRFDHVLVPLLGEHQATNCTVALGVLDQLKQRGMEIDNETAIAGLSKVRMVGRMEIIREEPRILVDVAHNAASVEALMRAIGQNIRYDSMVLIFGCCSDKDLPGMLRQIQIGADKIIFTRFRHPRAADPAELSALFAEISGRMAQAAPSLEQALEIAEKAVSREDLICITGSFHLVRDAKLLYEQRPPRPQTTAALAV